MKSEPLFQQRLPHTVSVPLQLCHTEDELAKNAIGIMEPYKMSP